MDKKNLTGNMSVNLLEYLSIKPLLNQNLKDKNTPTNEQTRQNYSDLLFKKLLPSFEKELTMQSVFVFQADGGDNKYVLLNRVFEKKSGENNKETYDVELNSIEEKMLDPLSCILDPTKNVTNELSNIASEQNKTNLNSMLKNVPKMSNGHNTSEQNQEDKTNNAKILPQETSSRRKRKFYKPMKIPQQSASIPEETDTKKIKLDEDKLDSVENNAQSSPNKPDYEDEEPDDLSMTNSSKTATVSGIHQANNAATPADTNNFTNNPVNFNNVLTNAFAANNASTQLSALFSGLDSKSLIIDANYRAMAPIFTTILSPHIQRPPLYCPLDLSNAANMGQFVAITPTNANNPRAPHSNFFNAASLSMNMPRPIRPRIASVAMVSPNASSTTTVNSTLNSINVANLNLQKSVHSGTSASSMKTNSRMYYQAVPPNKNPYDLEQIAHKKEEKKNSSVSENVDNLLQQARRYAKSFVCNQCKKVFASLSALCEHTFAIHKAFKCTICHAQFTQRSNLQRHSLRHVGFKPFICNICSKAYYRKDHLVRHIELSHPGANPRTSITVKLSSAECLDYLEKHPPDESEYATKVDFHSMENTVEMASNPIELVMKSIKEEQHSQPLYTQEEEATKIVKDVENLSQNEFEEEVEFTALKIECDDPPNEAQPENEVLIVKADEIDEKSKEDTLDNKDDIIQVNQIESSNETYNDSFEESDNCTIINNSEAIMVAPNDVGDDTIGSTSLSNENNEQ